MREREETVKVEKGENNVSKKEGKSERRYKGKKRTGKEDKKGTKKGKNGCAEREKVKVL